MSRRGCALRWTVVVVGLGGAGACGSTEHREPTTHPGGATSGGSDGSSTAGTSSGGQPPGGAGQSAQAGSLVNAGSTTGGATAGASVASAGTTDVGEGGAAGAASPFEGGAAGMSDGSAGAPGYCAPGCARKNPRNYCDQNEVEWACEGGFEREPYAAHCRNLPTGAIRFCCPTAFQANCF